MTCAEMVPLLELTPLLADDMGGANPLLQDAELQALDEHLAGCADCRAQAEAMKNAYALWGEAREQTMKPLSKTLRERVLADRAADAKRKGGVIAADPPADPEAVEAVRAKVVLSCSFCHDGMQRDASVFCASCLAPHHRECFAEHGRCTMPGCEETRLVSPSEAQQAASPEADSGKAKRGVVIALFLSAVTGLGVAAWTAAPGEVRYSRSQGSDLGQLERAELEGRRAEDRLAREAVAAGDALGDAEFEDGSSSVEELDGLDELGAEQLPPQRAAEQEAPLVNVDVDGASLAETVKMINVQAGLNVIVDPEVRERVRVSLRKIPAPMAVDVIARMSRCEIKTLPGGVRLLHQPARVTIQAQNSNARTLLDQVARSSGKNVFVGPEVRGAMDLELVEVHWKHAIDAIAKGVDLNVAWSGETALVTAKPFSLIPQAPNASLADEAGADAQVVSLSVEDAKVSSVCEQISRQAGVSVISYADDVRVSVQFKALRWDAAVTALAHLTGTVIERGEGVVSLTRPSVLDVSAQGAPSKALYRLLARAAGMNVTVHEDVKGAMSVRAGKIQPVHALECLAAVYGHQVRHVEGDVLGLFVGTAKLRGPVKATSGREPYVLSAIARGSETCVILDGELVSQGETLTGDDGSSVKVLKVFEDAVELEAGGKVLKRSLSE